LSVTALLLFLLLKPGLYATLDTPEGKITFELYEKYTPRSVLAFARLAQPPRLHFNGATFHRIIREEMIQAGGKECGLRIRDEVLPGLRFDRPGRVAMANAGPDTGGCEFFITSGVVSRWNNLYSIFGQVVEGQDVVDRINKSRLEGERPLHPVTINSVRLFRTYTQPPAQ